jgi:hypothetical protein
MKKKLDKDKKLTIIKSLFGIVPHIGTALDEIIYEHNFRLKQNRLNNFVEILADGFTENTNVNIYNIKSEDFNDLFMSVLSRVVKTKSELKLKRFKDILIKELKEPTNQIELNELYLDLITTLSEDEISILFHHRHFNLDYEDEITKLNKLKDKKHQIEQNQKKETIIIDKSKYEDEYIEVQKKIASIENWLNQLKKFKTAEYYNLDENKFMLFKQRLFSQGLLVDNRMNRISDTSFQNMGITEFGEEFLEFIKGSV